MFPIPSWSDIKYILFRTTNGHARLPSILMSFLNLFSLKSIQSSPAVPPLYLFHRAGSAVFLPRTVNVLWNAIFEEIPKSSPLDTFFLKS